MISPYRHIMIAPGRGGGVNAAFWKDHLFLKSQDILQVSMYGDSITSGDFNFPDDSHVWVPQQVSNIISQNASRTVLTGNQLATHPATSMVGTVYAGDTYTLTASVSVTNPRFINGLLPIVDGKIYRIATTLNAISCTGQHLTTRYLGYDSGAVCKFGGYSGVGTGGSNYITFSVDYLKSTVSANFKFAVGGEIELTDGGDYSGTIIINLYECSRGVAIQNQGHSGWKATDAITNVATVNNWTPDICIVAFGTNDIRAVGDIATLKADYLANLTTLVNSLKGAGIYPILATIPPLASDQANYTQVGDWNNAIKTLATTLGVGVWDRWSALNGDLAYIADGRHPTEEGYNKLSEHLASILI